MTFNLLSLQENVIYPSIHAYVPVQYYLPVRTGTLQSSHSTEVGKYLYASTLKPQLLLVLQPRSSV